MPGVDLGTAVGYLLLDTSGFTSGFSTARSALKTFQDESATAADKISAIGSAASSVGGTLTRNLTLPLAGIGTAIMKVGNDFEAQMSRVEAISGATAEEMERLNETAHLPLFLQVKRLRVWKTLQVPVLLRMKSFRQCRVCLTWLLRLVQI